MLGETGPIGEYLPFITQIVTVSLTYSEMLFWGPPASCRVNQPRMSLEMKVLFIFSRFIIDFIIINGSVPDAHKCIVWSLHYSVGFAEEFGEGAGPLRKC